MRDDNYWKEKYKDTWPQANEKEIALKEIIEARTSYKLVPYGLGADSSEFFSGSAKEYGKEIGAPDWQIEDTNIFLEVTGPNTDKVSRSAPLWFRPDKIENAIKYLDEHYTFLAHYLPSEDEWRLIFVSKGFAKRYQSKDFPTKIMMIRGTKEKYTEIPSTYENIISIERFIEWLNKRDRRKN